MSLKTSHGAELWGKLDLFLASFWAHFGPKERVQILDPFLVPLLLYVKWGGPEIEATKWPHFLGPILGYFGDPFLAQTAPGLEQNGAHHA